MFFMGLYDARTPLCSNGSNFEPIRCNQMTTGHLFEINIATDICHVFLHHGVLHLYTQGAKIPQ